MKHKSQSGFGHLVIITVVLAVAVVGLLGLVFYQNVMTKKNDDVSSVKVDNNTKANSNSDTDTVNDTANGTNDDPNKGYFVLDDWDVKFKLPDSLGSNTITYHKKGSGVYYVSTSRVEALGEMCATGEYGAAISRQTAQPPTELASTTFAGKVDQYYYLVSHAQAACSDTNTSMQESDSNMVYDMLLKVEKQ